MTLPMNMVTTSVGAAYLSQAFQASQLGYFSGFKFGSSNVLNLNTNLTNVAGNVVYVGNTTEMSYVRLNRYEVVLKASIGSNRGSFDIGSFAFLVGPSLVPFFIGRLEYIHKKQAGTDNQPGGIFTVQVKFKMNLLTTYWTFDNLVTSYAQADDSEPDYANIPNTFVKTPGYYRQVDIVPHNIDNRKGFLLYPGRKGLSWRAPDLHLQNTDGKFWGVYGGED